MVWFNFFVSVNFTKAHFAGTLSTGQGARYVFAFRVRLMFLTASRFMLADTQHLHRKISDMAQRIRQLEDALAIFQTSVSNEIHPLLQEELLSVKYGPEIQSTPTHNDGSQALADTFGTLTIGEHGEAKYFGLSAGSEVCSLAIGKFLVTQIHCRVFSW
jgi:hypothetical protein